jgi:uncharacterized Zn finger protein (UPF0148 family)
VIAKVRLTGRYYDNTQENALLKNSVASKRGKKSSITMTYPILVDVDLEGAEKISQSCPNCGSPKIEKVIFCSICKKEGAEIWVEGVGFAHKECFDGLKAQFPNVESSDFTKIDRDMETFRARLQESRQNPGGAEWLRRHQ